MRNIDFYPFDIYFTWLSRFISIFIYVSSACNHITWLLFFCDALIFVIYFQMFKLYNEHFYFLYFYLNKPIKKTIKKTSSFFFLFMIVLKICNCI